jgi:TonB family protein
MDTIRRVMRKHTPEIKYCFDRALLADKDTHGKVKVAFVISPTGAVVKADVAESTVGSASFESCMMEKISRIIFPAPDGGGIVEVKYPFVFNAPAAVAATAPAPAK